MHRFRLLLLCITFSLSNALMAQYSPDWRAGEVVSQSELKQLNIDSCFVAEKINDDVFARMWKKSYKTDCTIDRNELRYLRVLHVNRHGKTQMGELVCNKAIANDLVAIFRELYEAGYRIERMVLVDEYGADDEVSMSANNTSCFNFRKVAGTAKLSKHSLGMAIDINPRTNPCLHTKTGLVEPANGKEFAYDRNKRKSGAIEGAIKGAIKLISHQDLCYKVFKAHGFKWGGDWKTVVDYQHFEM